MVVPKTGLLGTPGRVPANYLAVDWVDNRLGMGLAPHKVNNPVPVPWAGLLAFLVAEYVSAEGL